MLCFTEGLFILHMKDLISSFQVLLLLHRDNKSYFLHNKSLYIYELICLTIGLWILLHKDLIINFYESCSCHCCCCVIHNNNNNNIYMLWCNTQQQQQQHNNIIKKLTEICYRKKCMTDLST